MQTQPAFTNAFQSSAQRTAELLFTDPAAVAGGAVSISTAWQLLLGSMALRRAGHRSEANDWLNHAARAKVDDDVFRAELFTEAGLGLNASDRLQDAVEMFNNAEPLWRDLTQTALAVAGKTAKKTQALTPSLSKLLIAAGIKFSAGSGKTTGVDDARLAQMWLDQRAVLKRGETLATCARILIKAGDLKQATTLCTEGKEWILTHFTTPAGPLAKTPLTKRAMSAAAREALYLLQLAIGEIELAGDHYQRSADAFATAAAIYEGNVTDYADISRLLRAKFNEANSLLRLGKFKQVLDIYDLVESGFNSINDHAAAQRVAQARLMVRSKQADAEDA